MSHVPYCALACRAVLFCDAQGEVLPHHSTWLAELDLRAEGLGALIDPDLVKADPSLVDTDLARVKEQLMQLAGEGGLFAWPGRADGRVDWEGRLGERMGEYLGWESG